MAIYLLSDVHKDSYENKGTSFFDHASHLKDEISLLNRSDILLLAGDFGNGLSYTREFLIDVRELTDAAIVAVLGNHDYHGEIIATPDAIGKSDFEEIKLGINGSDRIFMLENDTVHLDSYRIIGCTLWSDAMKGKMAKKRIAMSDFDVINGSDGELWSWDKMIFTHNKSKNYIERKLSEPFQGKTIVMTHFSPSYRSTHLDFIGSPFGGFFASDMDEFILDYQPDFWVHGHMHDPVDYKIGATRVISNPAGYLGERSSVNTLAIVAD